MTYLIEWIGERTNKQGRTIKCVTVEHRVNSLAAVLPAVARTGSADDLNVTDEGHNLVCQRRRMVWLDRAGERLVSISGVQVAP